MEDGKVIRVLQPTYNVDPSFDNRFLPNEVERHLTGEVADYLDSKAWSPDSREENTALTTGLTEVVLSKVKELGMTRYKIIVQVVVGENKDQTVRVGSQCLWEPDLDNIAEINFRNANIWSSVVVIGFYAH